MHNSPFNMRQYNLSILKPPVSKTAAGSSSSKASMAYTTAAKSLDLLRQNIQRNINQDIQTVISKYIDMFFKPGIENIRNNLGPEAVTEDHITSMCRQILEEAKRMYPVYANNASSSPSSGGNTNTSAIDPIESEPYNVQHPTPQLHQQQSQAANQANNSNDSVKLPLTSPSFGLKRESDTDSEASSLSNASKKMKKSGKKSNNGNSSASGNASGDTQSSGSSSTNNNSSNSNNNNNNNASSAKPKKPSGPSRKHVAQWEANKLTIETLFIMGAKANKALGFAQTRGRLYVKHPGLFKYASDADDKEWLSKNKLMPATGGRAYIMLLEDIEKLAKDNKLNVTINYEDIKGFRVPDFILDKMKSYINTWKKTYAEEALKASTNRNRNSNAKQGTSNSTPSSQATLSQNSGSMPITNNVINTNMNPINVPPPPTLPVHSQPQMQPQPQHPNPLVTNLNSYMSGPSSGHVLYDTSFATPQPHEMTEYKPPPMYPGHSSQPQQQQQQHPLQSMTNPGGGSYVHPNQLDPIEQAISKGDWSAVSDRSLLQYALQSTRNIGSWDPQDSFDLIESVTNGALAGGGGMGENSPLLQISPDAGVHLTAPTLGPVSPNCELNAVLDQAFQYTET